MAKSSLSRREFLKKSALGTSAMALSSCVSLDRYFMGDLRDLKNEVVILGAGAAGLAAAYELKKKKIPFRIFEASSRIGGRVHTVSVFPQPGPIAELGAEFFEGSHTQVLRLAKELNLPVSEIKPLAHHEAQMFSFSGKTYLVKDIVPRLKSLQNPLRRIRSDLFRDQDVLLNYKNTLQFERSQYYDTLSLRDLLESWKSDVDPIVLRLLEEQAVTRFGVDAAEQSSLHFLETLDGEGSSLLSGRGQYRLDGGLAKLMQSMADRVSGVIPDQIVKLNSPLSEISEVDGVFHLTFATDTGRKTFTTRNVICTIPFVKLREVQGLQHLQFSTVKKENISQQHYGSHSKGVLAFSSPFWRHKQGSVMPNLGNFTGDFVTQKFWDSGRSQVGEQGLLTFQRAGRRGQIAGVSAFDEALKDLQLFYADVPEVDSSLSQIVNWQQRPWSGGSMAVFRPGQYMKFKGVSGEAEYSGRFLFAGEHTSVRFAGTLQGALESGVKAASEVIL